MRILIIIAGLLLMSNNIVFAQYEPIPIAELPSDISARTYSEKVSDGTYCALWKIQTKSME